MPKNAAAPSASVLPPRGLWRALSFPLLRFLIALLLAPALLLVMALQPPAALQPRSSPPEPVEAAAPAPARWGLLEEPHPPAGAPRRRAALLYRLSDGAGSPMTYGAFLRLLRTSPAFRAWLRDVVVSCPFPAVLWESVPVTRACVEERPYAFALVSTDFRGGADRNAFAEKFAAAEGGGAVAFANIRGDATLCAPVPAPGTPDDTYVHFKSFLADAPPEQVQELLTCVGNTMAAALEESPAPRWLSTHGHGVSWLHVRIDSVPKYYTMAPFKSMDTADDACRLA